MNADGPDVIWIVERVRDEPYGQSRHAIVWCESRGEAEAVAARLQTEFDQACARVHPWYENVETIFEMQEEQTLASRHVWTDCDLEECGHLESPHQHYTQLEPQEHEEALIEQLTAWWHQENLAWQAFVENEVMSKMTDPPRYCRDLVRPDNAVHYECRAMRQDLAVTRAQGAAREKPHS
jgi:hypothetical protein